MTGTARVVVTGVPSAGKTTWSAKLGLPVYHLDEFADLGWSESSERGSYLFDQPGGWVVEGVAAPRALRKWLARNPEGSPCDVVYFLSETFDTEDPPTRGQESMGKGVKTVLLEIEAELVRRGVRVEWVP